MAKRRTSSSHRRRSLGIESLERRAMAAIGTCNVRAGVLEIFCNDANDNVMVTETLPVVVRPPVTAAVTRAAVIPVKNGTVTVRDLTRMTVTVFDRSTIQSITILGNGGDDMINVWSSLPTSVAGMQGNDWIATGDGDDTINGGPGKDTIMSNGGNDVVYGESSFPFSIEAGISYRDVINGGNGDDKIYGGPGEDTIMGGAGNDVIDGGDADSGGNILYGNDGDDTFASKNRDDSVDGGNGYDTAAVLAGVYVLRNCETVTIAVPDDQPQTDGWSCGPNSASRLMRAYGIDASYATMRSLATEDSLLTQCHLGTTPNTVADIVHRFKPEVSLEKESSLGRVTQLLSSGKPVMVLVSMDVIDIFVGTIGLMHYVVLDGYNASTQTVQYVDTNGAHGSWRMAEFDFHWKWFDYFSGLGAGYQATLYGAGLRKRTLLA